MKEVIHRDQIHSDVRLDPLAVRLLDTPSVQRLGRVYQLGYAHYVYRGGTHTRLGHVMGAYHVAGKIVKALRDNYDRSTSRPAGDLEPSAFLPPVGSKSLPTESQWDILLHLVRWAALLHDIGHVPIGHTLEDEFSGIYQKHDDLSSPRMPFLWYEVAAGKESEIRRAFRQATLPESFQRARLAWEKVWETVLLICLYREDKDGIPFGGLSGETSAFAKVVQRALGSANGVTFFPYMADIVGNTICADFLDYLQRDPTNLGLDVLSYERVISRFWVGRDKQGNVHMALSLVDRRGKPRLDTTTAVVDLVRQRFRFAESVYYHKTKVSASAMFAKVFQLIGKPDELPPSDRQEIRPSDVDVVVASAFEPKGAKRAPFLEQLRRTYLPSALLDPEIGDESLHLLLFHKAWTEFENAIKDDQRDRAREALRAIALLQAIVRRRLYKVCFSINKETFSLLAGGSREDEEVESRLARELLPLRKDASRRAQLEEEMSKAAGLLSATPPIYDSFILYVPPRKSQAKGIETRALDRGELVTLGRHSVVSGDVRELNKKYVELWKLLLFVHPDLEKDALRLSNAIDALMKSLFPGISLYDEQVVATIKAAAWFDYVRIEFRPAAKRYSALATPREPSWTRFERSRTTVNGATTDEEYALRALLLGDREATDNARDPVESIREQFAAPGSLQKRVDEVMETAAVEAFRGAGRDSQIAHAVETVAKGMGAGEQLRLA